MTTQSAHAPVCTAAERIQNALYRITLMRGTGIFDLGALTQALTGDNECEGHPVPAEPNPFARPPYSAPFIGRGIPQ